MPVILLHALAVSVFIFALWRKSYAAMWFGFLTVVHGVLMSGYDESDTLFWMTTGGVSSTLSTIGCYLLRRGIKDTVAFWMTGISLACLATNIICIITWYYDYSMEGFGYVFASILIASLIAIGKGDKGELGKTTGGHFGRRVYTIPTQRRSILATVAIRQEVK